MTTGRYGARSPKAGGVRTAGKLGDSLRFPGSARRGSHAFPARRSSVSSSEASKTWLSKDAYDRLQAELDQMIADRPKIAAEINARREEGDLRENGGYHAAREEQGKAEGRILYLKELLRTAEVGT